MHLLVLISADLVLGGTIFPEGGHYSPVNNVLGGQYSPVNNVQGDIFRGDRTVRIKYFSQVVY